MTLVASQFDKQDKSAAALTFADSLREAHDQQLTQSGPEEVQTEQPVETEAYEPVMAELAHYQDEGPEEGALQELTTKYGDEKTRHNDQFITGQFLNAGLPT